MGPFLRILVALGRDDLDPGLLRYAAMLGCLNPAAELHVVHVAGNTNAEGQEALLRKLRDDVLAYLAIDGCAGRAACHVLCGDLTDNLLGFAARQRIDVVLLGHRAKHSGRRALARRLAMAAPCSVWMAPEGSAPTLKKILVPIDFSRRSADAVALATSLAEAAGLDECLALHVYFNQAAVTYEEYDEIIIEEEERDFHLFTAPINLRCVDVKPLFIEGHNVAHTINRVAAEQGADLIVMGTRGRSRSAAVLLGSETEETIMAARAPILAVKHFGARMQLLQVLRDRRLRDKGHERFT